MPSNLKIIRIQPKLENLFNNKIDISDANSYGNDNCIFYTRSIAALSIIMRCGVDEDIAGQSITDGFHDMGIDAIYNDTSQKKLILVQSKWRRDGSGGVSQTETGSFISGIKRIISFDFDGCNEKIQAKKQDITSALKDMDYQIEIIFCHTGSQSMSEYALRPIKELQRQVNEDGSSELLIFSEIKLQDIYDYLADGQNRDNIVLDDVLLSNWGAIDGPLKAYYGIVPVSAVGEWYKTYGNRLFAKNIRYYKGSTEVNQGIKDILKTNPDKFFYYNNGIKILCKKITKKAAHSTDRVTGLFVLEGASLVNGAQTAGAIGSIFMETPELISNARVFIQMIELGDAGEEQATQITKLSNTQNRIDGKDFASLDPQQERLRKELSLSGIQYLYKSGATIEDSTHQISLDEAIVAQACSLDDLSIIALVKRNIGALTENIEKQPYKLLFNGGTNSFALYNGVMTLREVDSYIKEKETTESGRKRLVLIHGNRFILHRVLLEVKNDKYFNSANMENKQIKTLVQNLCPNFLEKTYDAMEKKFSDAYPANIFKNVGRLKEIVNHFSESHSS